VTAARHKRRAKRRVNSWDETRVRRELEEFLTDATEWPSYRDFQHAGRENLRNKVTRFGGARRWAKRLGLPYPVRKPGYAPRWTEERVRAGLMEFLVGRSSWPSRMEFEQAGRKPLRDAVRRLGGPERWAAEFDLPLRNLKSGSKRAWTHQRIEAELRKVIGRRGTWPSRRELEQRGRPGLVGAIYHGQGAEYWAHRVGVARPPRPVARRPRVWTDERILAELREFCAGRTTWPTEKEFVAAGRARLYGAACHYGGVARWASELGVVHGRNHGSTRSD